MVADDFERPRIGCAGWNIPPNFASLFAKSGAHLEKYASRFSAVEINSSFYRLHRFQTYVRWAASVPEDFRFSVKVPKQITHELQLRKARAAIDEFLATVAGLGSKLAVLLVQLPPSFKFSAPTATAFFKQLVAQCSCAVVCEPRHASWFTSRACELLKQYRVSLVFADPTPSGCEMPTVSTGQVTYYRLHGRPRVYYSRYELAFLQSLAPRLLARSNSWCIFDNTAEGWAVQNALEMQQLARAVPVMK